jgi:pteridine reductase
VTPSTNTSPEATAARKATEEWALVTGGSGRGGAAICRALHARGLSVVIHHTARSIEEAEGLRAELEAIRPGSTRLWCADFTDPLLTVPAWIPDLGISVLVCNASTYHPGGIDDIEAVSREVALNITSNATILNALRPSAPVSAGRPSALRSVVAVTDIAVDRIPKGHVAYTTGKGALQSFILTLSTDWAPIRFNVVQPGTLPFPEDWKDEERQRKIMETIPLGRIGSFEDLAGAVVFLALDATYVTGQVLAVDGGRSRQMH